MARIRAFTRIILLAVLISACLVHAEETKDENEVPVDANEAERTGSEEVESSDEGSDEVREEDDVLVLTTKNFDSVVNEKDIILVEFYAPWCGHCKSLAPEYSKAAKTMKTNDPPVSFAKVDATVESEVAQRFDVSGYPTLKIFRKGAAYDYDGPREEQGIVSYMKEQADPNWKPPPVAALVLTKDNFTDVVNRESLMLVEFFAPWCGHCKQLAPVYEKAAKELRTNDPPILLATVDATQESELAQKYNVQGYPTLKVFRKGKATEYKGKRDQHGIESYMRGQVGPSSRLLSSMKAVQDFLKSKDSVAIMGFFDGADDKLLENYLEANNDVRDDYPFAHTFDANAKKYYGIKKSSIVLFQPERFRSKYEAKQFVYEGKEFTPDALQDFYKKKQIPLVGLYNSYEKKNKYTERPLCVVYYSVDFGFENRVATQFWRTKVLEVAKDHRDVTFAIANEEEATEDLKEFGLEDSGEEINVGCFDKEDKKYRMDPDGEEFSEDSFREFIEELKAGNLKPVIKSQPVPKSNNGPVKIVVGKSFDDIVLDDKKDVLIELYAPWCGHCKKLEPIYKKLGKHFKDQKNIVIAKMDATANDLPKNFAAEGFPTIYFATAKDKNNPIKFEGDRKLKDFIKFIEEKATVSLTKSSKEEL